MLKWVVVKRKEKDPKTNKEFWYYLLKYANIDYHKMLVGSCDECLGGGLFSFDHDNETMIIWGKSDDFGSVDFSSIKDRIHIDEEMQGWKIILRNGEKDIDITERFEFDYW